MSAKKTGLGRGLSALLVAEEDNTLVSTEGQNGLSIGSISYIPLKKIEANPYQPRTDFDKTALNELAESIKQQGIIQPVTVRKVDDGGYQLISGERRFKASKMAGLEEIPAYIRTANDQQMLEMALVENIQRENLNAIEIAINYQRLIEECNHTQESLSEHVGKNRSTVANYLRLLKLPPEIQLGIREAKITMGHARAIINIDNADLQKNIFYKITEKDLSVRAVEELVRSLNDVAEQTVAKKTANTLLPKKYQAIRNDLSLRFDAKIDLKLDNKGKGAILIKFKNDVDLDRILSLLEKGQ